MNSENVIVAVITGILTYFATQTKSKYDVKRQEIESDSTTEGIYVENMTAILAEYKEQVSSFRDEVKGLREENRALKDEFKRFKESHKREIDEYKKYTELLESENEDLREENADLKYEILVLKGDEIND